MAFKTFTAGETLTASDVNTYLAKQAVIVCTSGTRPGSPVEGMCIFETDTDKFLSYDGTNWTLPDNVAGGTVGYAEVTADQTGIGSSVTDLTGLSVTFTAVANRRYRLTGQGHISPVTTAGAIIGTFREGTTEVGRWAVDDNTTTAGTQSLESGFVILAPSAGAHTYKMSLVKSTGGNTVNFIAAGTGKAAFLLAEDIGAA